MAITLDTLESGNASGKKFSIEHVGEFESYWFMIRCRPNLDMCSMLRSKVFVENGGIVPATAISSAGCSNAHDPPSKTPLKGTKKAVGGYDIVCDLLVQLMLSDNSCHHHSEVVHVFDGDDIILMCVGMQATPTFLGATDGFT